MKHFVRSLLALIVFLAPSLLAAQNNKPVILPVNIKPDTGAAQPAEKNDKIYTQAISDKFRQADAAMARKAYENKDYRLCIAIWRKLIAGGDTSAENYYNLGAAYYRTGNIAPAILSFERAHRLAPQDADINYNLRLARLKTIDRIHTDLSDSSAERAACIISLPIAVTSALISFILLLGGTLLYFTGDTRRKRRAGFYLALSTLPIFILFNLTIYLQHRAYNDTSGAIIISPEVRVRSTPDTAAAVLFVLHDGTKVHITGSALRGWLPVSIGSDLQGWVPINSLERIVLD